MFIVHFDPTDDGSVPESQAEPPVTDIEPYKSPASALHPMARFRRDETQAQDHMAWETQGPIADREHERLATTDRGIVMLRESSSARSGVSRPGTIPREWCEIPDHAVIDTNLAATISRMREDHLPIGSTREEAQGAR